MYGEIRSPVPRTSQVIRNASTTNCARTCHATRRPQLSPARYRADAATVNTKSAASPLGMISSRKDAKLSTHQRLPKKIRSVSASLPKTSSRTRFRDASSEWPSPFKSFESFFGTITGERIFIFLNCIKLCSTGNQAVNSKCEIKRPSNLIVLWP